MSEIEKPGSCPVFFVLGSGFGVTEALATWVPEVRLLRQRIIFAGHKLQWPTSFDSNATRPWRAG